MASIESKVGSMALHDPAGDEKIAANESLSKLISSETFNVEDEELGVSAVFVIWHLQQSTYVWIGQKGLPPVMPHLIMGCVDRFNDIPTATIIKKNDSNADIGMNIARRVAKRLGKIIFVTCNLQDGHEEKVSRFIEKELVKRLS